MNNFSYVCRLSHWAFAFIHSDNFDAKINPHVICTCSDSAMREQTKTMSNNYFAGPFSLAAGATTHFLPFFPRIPKIRCNYVIRTSSIKSSGNNNERTTDDKKADESPRKCNELRIKSFVFLYAWLHFHVAYSDFIFLLMIFSGQFRWQFAHRAS